MRTISKTRTKKGAMTLVLALLCYSPFAQDVSSKNEALYLANFTKYFEWSDEEVTIGVLGNSDILSELEALRNQNPKINVVMNIDERKVKDCDMIFIPESHTAQFDSIQESIGTAPIVLVTENEELASKGAEISFYVVEDQLRFVVNRSALSETGIKMSTKLLSHAKIID